MSMITDRISAKTMDPAAVQDQQEASVGIMSQRIVAALAAQWKCKVLYGLALYLAFWPIYAILQWHHSQPVIPVPITRLDDGIPFLPGFVFLYLSLFPFMSVAPWLLTRRADLKRYCLGIIVMSLVAFSIFAGFPTSVQRPGNSVEANHCYQMLIRMDGELNAFPSLHAAFAFYHGACCHWAFPAVGLTRFRWLSWVWVGGIMAAILLTKQHLLIDTAAGVVLGALAAAVFFRRISITDR